MLDKTTAELLSHLNDNLKSNEYVVLEADDIIISCKSANFTFEILDDAMTYLDEHDYIKLRYRGGGEYCLSVLAKGRQYAENERLALFEKEKAKENVWIMCFAGGTLGGFTGGFLAALILRLLGF